MYLSRIRMRFFRFPGRHPRSRRILRDQHTVRSFTPLKTPTPENRLNMEKTNPLNEPHTLALGVPQNPHVYKSIPPTYHSNTKGPQENNAKIPSSRATPFRERTTKKNQPSTEGKVEHDEEQRRRLCPTQHQQVTVPWCTHTSTSK